MTFSAENEARFLTVARQPPADMFILLMDTGMRPEEVIGSVGEMCSGSRTQSACPTARPRPLGWMQPVLSACLANEPAIGDTTLMDVVGGAVCVEFSCR